MCYYDIETIDTIISNEEWYIYVIDLRHIFIWLLKIFIKAEVYFYQR